MSKGVLRRKPGPEKASRPSVSESAPLIERERQPRSIPWAVGILVVAMLFGGGSTRGAAVEAVLVVLGIAMLAILLLLHWTGLRPVGKGAMALVSLYGGLALLGLIQVIPVPGPWTGSSLHGLAQDVRQVAGFDTPHPMISLDPDATLRFVASLSVPAAVALAVAGASVHERRKVLYTIALIAAASTLLALLQVALGGQTWLLPYEGFGRATGGLMNNVNHQGLLASLGLLAATGFYLMRKREPLVQMRLRERKGYRRDRAVPRIWLLAAFAVWMAVGVAVSLSMAAVVLGILALVGVPLIIRFERIPRLVYLVAAGATLGFLAAVAVFLFSDSLTDPGERSLAGRFEVYPALFALLRESFPWGVGVGAFVPAYRTQEGLDTLLVSYLNHAHNEPLHILIEGGLIGVAVIGVAAFFLIRAGRERWDERSTTARRAMLASAFALLLVGIHGLVDFPLRTTSIASASAAFLALLVTKAQRPREAVRVAPVRLFAAVPIAVLVGLAAVPAYRSWTAEHHVSNALFERALRVDPGHPQALAGRSWRLHTSDPETARTVARAAIARAPLQSPALRTLLVLDGDGRGIDRAGWTLASRLGWHDSVTQTVLAVDDLQRGADEDAAEHVIALLRRRGLSPELAALIRPRLLDDGFRSALVGRLGSGQS